MHEIAFQADNRFAEWSVSADCSSLFLFHEGILFVITFTRRIYSTSSHVFLPDSFVLPLWREVGCQAQLLIFTPPACPPWIIVLSD